MNHFCDKVYLACCRAAGLRDIDTCRACRVVSTLSLGEAWVSPALAKELEHRSDIEVVDYVASHDLNAFAQILETGLTAFDLNGELVPF